MPEFRQISIFIFEFFMEDFSLLDVESSVGTPFIKTFMPLILRMISLELYLILSRLPSLATTLPQLGSSPNNAVLNKLEFAIE